MPSAPSTIVLVEIPESSGTVSVYGSGKACTVGGGAVVEIFGFGGGAAVATFEIPGFGGGAATEAFGGAVIPGFGGGAVLQIGFAASRHAKSFVIAL